MSASDRDIATSLKLDCVAETTQHFARIGANPAAPIAVAVDTVNMHERDAVPWAVMRFSPNSQVGKFRVGSLQGDFNLPQMLATIVVLCHVTVPPRSTTRKVGRISS